ncbi:hypothetical protein [Nonomuraea sp. NPDC049625]|uniref:hypothetical protein n=1 Tax=Nonomuraea sp. NPDC049625 TaxID=3155775 RepID=UPI003415E39D
MGKTISSVRTAITQWIPGRRVAPIPPPPGPNDHESLVAALEHATRWYEYRISQGLQVLNFYLVSTAVNSAAYVAALQAKLDAVAGAVGLVAALVSVAAALAGWRSRGLARLALQPIAEIQDRLAATLNMDSLRLVQRNPHRTFTTPISLVMFVLACAISVSGALYAWLR